MVAQFLVPLAIQYGPTLVNTVTRLGANYVESRSASAEAMRMAEFQHSLAETEASLAFRRQVALAGATALFDRATTFGRSSAQHARQQALAEAARSFEREREAARAGQLEAMTAAERQFRMDLAESEHARRLVESRIAQRDAHYPFDHGPGHLRASLLATHPGPRRPLLVLLAPLGEGWAAQDAWSGLPDRIQGELMRYQGFDSGVVVRVAQRRIQWPDIDLYGGDLTDMPTVVLETSIDQQRLDLRLGGCHLIPDALSPLHEMRAMCTLRFPSAEEWTPAEVERLNATSGMVGMGRLPDPTDPASVRELNHELAARLVTLCVMTAVDCYHIMHTPAYDEQLDRVAQAAGLPAAPWPIDYRIPLDAVHDPAYHLLQRAGRQRAAAASAAATAAATGAATAAAAGAAALRVEADQTLLLAVSLLAGHDTARTDIPFDELLTAVTASGLASEQHLAQLDAQLKAGRSVSAYGEAALPPGGLAAMPKTATRAKAIAVDPNRSPFDR